MRKLGVSRAYVTQCMTVLAAPAALLDAIRKAEADGTPVTERTWRRIRSLEEGAAVGPLLDGG